MIMYELDWQTTQEIPFMMRLPGEAASIMAGQELVVPRWHTCVANLVTQHRHTSSLGLSFGICLETISLQWPAISPENTEATVDLDGLASRFFTWD